MQLQTMLNHMLRDRSPKAKEPSVKKLKMQAAKLGLTIEVDRVGREIGYWINGTNWTDGTFCSSKSELEYKLNNFTR
jgi:hypothetical protein